MCEVFINSIQRKGLCAGYLVKGKFLRRPTDALNLLKARLVRQQLAMNRMLAAGSAF
jgi:hypothetical protein